MSNCAVVQIDAKKLEKTISENGWTRARLSRELGFAEGYFSNVVKRKRMSRPALKLLAQKLNVPEEYLKAQPEQETKEPEQETKEPEQETKEPEQTDVQLSNIESLLCAVLAELKIMNKDRDLFAAMLLELKKLNK